jgi:hypothetical protein
VLTAQKSLAVMNWQIDNIQGLCTDDQPQKFICVGINTFFSSSMIWGTLGPQRMYGKHGLYGPTLWGFLAGAILPVPFYVFGKRYPSLRQVCTPVLLIGGLLWAPANLTWVIPPLWLGYIFLVYIKRRHFAWWASYNVSPRYPLLTRI